MPQSVLYRNEPGTVVLIDLPLSIQNAQNSTYALKSSQPLESPYPGTEPKGFKRDAAIRAIALSERVYHESVQTTISLALDEIRTHIGEESWCCPRGALTAEVALHMDTVVSCPPPAFILSTTESHTEFPSFSDVGGSVVHNIRSDSTVLAITSSGDFAIPARSTFLLASLEQGFSSFESGWRDFSPRSSGFDLILMDPPWPNRSVRHSNAYKTQEDQAQDPFEKAIRIVGSFLAPKAWVAIWVTNKLSIRATVLDSLHELGLSLQEEWIWIKTTIKGEPVSQLDGVWRRPYEALLLFRNALPTGIPKRRVIAAVPDLHSRKPNLKTILEELLPSDYSALELFARSLTAGWWSWGDEVLKFQHESQWETHAHKQRPYQF